MDKKINKAPFSKKKIGLLIGGAVVLILLIMNTWNSHGKSELNTDFQKLNTDTIRKGIFQEFIPINGIVQPLRSVYIDAIEGGRIEERFVEEGNLVKKGEPIVRLSNTDLQLNFMNRETNLLDQMNNMRNTLMLLDQNHLQLRQQLLETSHAYAEQKRLYERQKKLFSENVIAKAEFEKSESDFEYLSGKKNLLIVTIKKDSVFKSNQTRELESNIHLIQKNLEMIKQNLENLIIKAPISGQLTALTVEIGETRQKAQNIGQIDVLEGYKIRAGIDEHYISRVFTGQKAEFIFDEIRYELIIQKVFPQVINGQFEVDLLFTGLFPKEIKQGQSLQIKLALSAQKQALIVKRGGFYQNTGGNWIYVVKNGKASKKDIKIGRQNPDYYEILEGLKPGDIVITSNYEVFGQVDELILKN